MKIILTSAFVATAAALSACGTMNIGAHRLNSSPEIPGAVGTVKFKRVEGDDTGIELKVRNLAEPEQLSPPGYAYVAWVRSTPEDSPQNVGALDLGPDLGGVLQAETPLRRFELFVTAEATSDAPQPTGPLLLWANRE